MQTLEVSGAVRPLWGSLSVKGLSFQGIGLVVNIHTFWIVFRRCRLHHRARLQNYCLLSSNFSVGGGSSPPPPPPPDMNKFFCTRIQTRRILEDTGYYTKENALSVPSNTWRQNVLCFWRSDCLLNCVAREDAYWNCPWFVSHLRLVLNRRL